MIGVASSIKDNAADTLLFRALGNKLAYLASGRYFPIVRNGGHCLDAAQKTRGSFSQSSSRNLRTVIGCRR